jgi:mRNA-degrading endonuclease HigB of HigAB toxin-antitoxin module
MNNSEQIVTYEFNVFISRKRLVQFATIHTDSETALDNWYRTAKTADWQNLVELRESYQKAAVKLNDLLQF